MYGHDIIGSEKGGEPMLIGQKIREYRKSHGMSQEELGQKLMLSRQTISQWEKEQTVPTIDNLLRLKEIFGVSVDEILGGKSETEKQLSEPLETYRFSFSKEEFEKTNKTTGRAWNRSVIIICLLYAAIILLLMVSNEGDGFTGFLMGALPLGILFAKGIKANAAAAKNRNEKAGKNLYEYMVYEDYFTAAIIRNNETVRTSKYYFSEIEQIYNADEYLAVVVRGGYYLLRKSELKENSAFYVHMKRYPAKTVEPKPFNIWRMISIVMFVASLLSIFGAMAAVTEMSQRNKMQIENMWIFYLFALIPAASVVVGFILKAKGDKYKKNIIAGIIMTVILCVYGSFSFIFADVYDHGEEPIIRVEEVIKIDIPEHRYINTIDWTEGVQAGETEHGYYTSDVYFDNEAAECIEVQIKKDSRWLSERPNELIGISSPYGGTASSGNVIIYNTDTDEYNTLPKTDGNYHFISVTYNSEEKIMRIAEYNIDYIS